jgi:hypothetical protein
MGLGLGRPLLAVWHFSPACSSAPWPCLVGARILARYE